MTPDGGVPERTLFAIRVAAACALLVGVALVQSPGLLVADTKLDLAVDPAGFLGRALHLWDDRAAFGQLHNQAYGYLWPMGPFFLLGSALDVPGWVVQRLWVALVMCVALTGAALLAREMGVRSHLARLVAGFAYALSPRMLTTLGPISIEAWPSALAPWVLLPLVVGAVRGSPRRAAALSAVAVAMVGGVNAAATSAVLPLGVLWLVTRSPGPRRRALMVWWPVFTLLGTLWWLVPLFMLGAYSPPFLDFIESAGNTTAPTTLFNALRGTSHWVAYVDPSYRTGRDLVAQFGPILNSGVLLMFGAVGLMRPRTPHRLFLVLAVVTGLVLVTAGHQGQTAGWAAASVRDLLDGPLAPLRNVHKFDPVVRLPAVLGLAFLLDALVDAARDRRGRAAGGDGRALAPVIPVTLAATILVALVGTTSPLLVGRLAPSGGFSEVPGYWSQAAAWLATRDAGGKALVVPGSGFGTYLWGTPRDEPMQFLADSPWAIRNAIPLAPAGNIRMLDALEARMARGDGSPGLVAALRRAGVTHLVVRNDLERGGDLPELALVHQALARSPGLSRVATFGPLTGGEAHVESGAEAGRVVINSGWQELRPAVEVFQVGSGRAVVADAASTPTVVVGGPEDLPDLADAGLVGDGPTVMAYDVERGSRPPGPVVLTDGLRRTERSFGRTHDGTSATLARGDPLRLDAAARDYLPDEAAQWETVAAYDGVAGVTASSSMADANAQGLVQPGRHPGAAVDGDPSTAWVSNYGSEPAWWQVELATRLVVPAVELTAGPDAPETVRVRTEHAMSEALTVPAGATRTVPVDDTTGWLRIEDASGRTNHRVTIAEVVVPGATALRALVLPRPPTSWGAPDAVLLRTLADERRGCAEVGGDVRCSEQRVVHGEEANALRRVVTVGEGAVYEPRLSVRLKDDDAALRELLDRFFVGVAASSHGARAPRSTALAAVDGNPGTTWIADGSDPRPTLTLNWLGRQAVRSLRFTVDPDTAARLPRTVTLAWPDGSRRVEVNRSGRARFPAIRTDRLELRVEDAYPARQLDFDLDAARVPVGVSELRLDSVPYLPVLLSPDPVRLPCGSGPSISVGTDTWDSRVVGSPAELYAGTPVAAEPCGTAAVKLETGENHVSLVGSDLVEPTSLVLTRGDTVGAASAEAELLDGDADSMTIAPGAGSGALLALRRNANPGWAASQGGREVSPVVVDGWRQGWRLVEGDAPVELTFTPDRAYRGGLLLGALTFLGLVAASCAMGRRWPGAGMPPSRSRAMPALGLAAVALLAGGVLLGWGGTAVAAVVLAATRLTRASAASWGAWLVAGLLPLAALAYAVRPWGGLAGWGGALGWPDYLVLVVVVACVGWLAEGGWSPPSLLRRSAGSSTRR